LNGVES